MDKEQTLALWAKGRDAWNAWAKEMLARRAELEANQEFKTSRPALNLVVPQNEATAGWFDAARADFSANCFSSDADFRDWLFPHDAVFANASFGYYVDFGSAVFNGSAHFDKATFRRSASFDKATFRGYVWFRDTTVSARASFGGATFNDAAWFDSATFEGDSWFADAKFGGLAVFKHTRFRKDVWFHNATFSNDADFQAVKFGEVTWFRRATFAGPALFENALFSGHVKFDHSSFSGDAEFQLTMFEGYASFASVHFDGAVSFHAANASRGLLLSGNRFAQVPDFIQAHVAEAPRLDNVVIPQVRGISHLFWWLLQGAEAEPDKASRFRALKRLAIAGHDHEREQEFFAYELKSLRPGGARYWFGLGYEVFSDFGRSMLRPLGWLLLGIGGFGWAYLGAHFARSTYGVSSGAWLLGRLGGGVADLLRWLASGFPPEAALRDIAGWLGRLLAPSAPLSPLTCIAGDQTDPVSAAIGLSVRKALPFAGVASSEKLNQIYACLYGITEPTAPGTALPGRFTPLIPDGVDGLGIVQLLLSLVLLFLFALAVRNHFRIR